MIVFMSDKQALSLLKDRAAAFADDREEDDGLA